MALTLVPPTPAGPILEELLLPDVKAHLRIDGTLEDALLVGYGAAARRWLEGRDGWLNRAFLTQSWEWTLDAFPAGELRLPLAPLRSVTAITYRAPDGSLATLAPAAYEVDAKSEPGRLRPAVGTCWPSTSETMHAVAIVFEAGYGTTLEALPQPIRLALIGIMSDYYEHRAEATLFGVSATNAGQPAWVEALLASYRVWGA